jgi:prepilin-type N-terminal cleavage/methylation domain-containing protein
MRRRAFTLIELLVVVAIIAVLIAILLPSLGRAKANAVRVKCAAQLKQWGMVITMYAQENQDWFGAYFKDASNNNHDKATFFL